MAKDTVLYMQIGRGEKRAMCSCRVGDPMQNDLFAVIRQRELKAALDAGAQTPVFTVVEGEREKK